MSKANVQNNTADSEIVNSLRFHHDKLVKMYDDSIISGQKEKEPYGDAGANLFNVQRDLKTYFETFSFSFDVSLCEIDEYYEGNNDTMDFGQLMIALGRSLTFCRNLIENICRNNIGESVISESNPYQSMEAAFKWLFSQSTKAEDQNYQDEQRLKRLLWHQMFMLHKYLVKEERATHKKHSELIKQYHELCRNLQTSSQKVVYIKNYKTNIEKLISDTFAVLKELSVYYGYMKQTSESEFESELPDDAKNDQKCEKKREYCKISRLLTNVRNILIWHFSSFVKIGGMNAPHINLELADFVSSDMSDSNFINSNFKNSDLSSVMMRDTDISSSNLTYCNAENASLSGSVLNSCILEGCCFRNTDLAHAKVLDVIFRNIRYDTIKRDELNFENIEAESPEGAAVIKRYWDEREKIKNTIIKDYIIEKKKDLKESFTDLSRQKQKDGKTTELWDLTTSNLVLKEEERNTGICIGNSMDDAVKKSNANISDFYNALCYYTFPNKKINKVPEGSTTVTEIIDANLKNRDEKESRIADLGGIILTDAIVFETDFCLLDMSSSSLNGAEMGDSIACYTDMTNASMVGTNVSNTYFCKASFENVVLEKSNFIESVLIDCNFRGANLANAVMLKSTHIHKTDYAFISKLFKPLKQGDLVEELNDDTVISSDIDYIDTNFNDVKATRSFFMGINADRSSWINANLKQSVLLNMMIRWAYLDSCDFSYAIICGVSMHQSSLQNVLMPQSRMYGCDMSGTKLRGANFTGGRMDKIYFENSDLSNSNFSRSRVVNCVFKDVNFQHTNLTDTWFFNTVFINVDFSSCIGFSRTQFKNCVFYKNCSEISYLIDANHQTDKRFMSIHCGESRLKFFKEEGYDQFEKEFNTGRYTSLTYIMAHEGSDTDTNKE